MCPLTETDPTLWEKGAVSLIGIRLVFLARLKHRGMLEYKTDELSGSGWFCDRLNSKDRQRAFKELKESGCKRQFGRQLP